MEQLIDAILQALSDAEITAVKQLPQISFPHLTAPVTAVGLHAAKAADYALFCYLGKTERNGEDFELYGKELKAEIFLQTVCPRRLGAECCMQQTDRIVELLAEPMQAVSLTGFSVGACEYDAQADVFSMTVTAQVRAYLYALSTEDETEFTEFILKGEVQ